MHVEMKKEKSAAKSVDITIATTTTEMSRSEKTTRNPNSVRELATAFFQYHASVVT